MNDYTTREERISRIPKEVKAESKLLAYIAVLAITFLAGMAFQTHRILGMINI